MRRKMVDLLKQKLGKGKVIVLIGARQVGKTTLLKSIFSEYEAREVQFWNCDESDIRELLSSATSTKLKALAGSSKFIVIDEAQRVKNIGLAVKLLHDSMPEVQLAVTGSSSLELSSSINEPLTGRKFEYNLFPFSVEELAAHASLLEETRLLETRLVYGFYPDVVNNPGDEKEILKNLASSYLYKDMLEFQDVRKSGVIEKLLQALALQTGSEVSFNELSNLLGIDSLTVQRYVDLLEKVFVVFHLRSFSRNVRNELKKSMKIYFYDNGIRNAIISNFSPVELRTDKGALWENFLISERLKMNAFNNRAVKSYFWRTTQKQEIDYIEEADGFLNAYEFKYNPLNKAVRCPLTFSANYPESKFSVVTKENYTDFVLPG